MNHLIAITLIAVPSLLAIYCLVQIKKVKKNWYPAFTKLASETDDLDFLETLLRAVNWYDIENGIILRKTIEDRIEYLRGKT